MVLLDLSDGIDGPDEECKISSTYIGLSPLIRKNQQSHALPQESAGPSLFGRRYLNPAIEV